MTLGPPEQQHWARYWSRAWATKLDAIKAEVGTNAAETWERVKDDCQNRAEAQVIQWAIYRVCGPFTPTLRTGERLEPPQATGGWRTHIDEWNARAERATKEREARAEALRRRIEERREQVKAAATGGNRGMTMHVGALPSLDRYDRLQSHEHTDFWPVRDWYDGWRKRQALEYGT